ncbi:MAG UNVERIFIED_CONTAM: ATP-binding cassette domain-containing protein [Planctomycetaceae bacterium]|jgi:ABC-2 type transport system ATP-binding protein
MLQYDRDTVPAINVSRLSHAFRGHQALNDVTFCVMPQTLHGFVGPNGAGKTTTLKVICTLLRQSRGEVEVFGSNVRTDPASVPPTNRLHAGSFQYVSANDRHGIS